MIVLWCFFILAFKTAHSDLEEKKVVEYYSQQFVYPGAWWSVKDEMRSLIYATAIKSHIDPELLLRIAQCESNLNPKAKNPLSSASGLFQFLTTTYLSYAKRYEIGLDKNNPQNQAELAAKMIADGKISHWQASITCWQE